VITDRHNQFNVAKISDWSTGRAKFSGGNKKEVNVLDRIIRAVRLDPTLYREVSEDQNSMTEAAIIVVVVTFLAAVGTAVGVLIGQGTVGRAFLSFLNNWLISDILIGWIGWAILTYFVGTMLFKGKTDIPEMMRVLGFASAPRLLGIFGIIPCLGWIASLAGWILSLIAGVIAIREAMEFDTGNAIITVVISWVIALVISLIIGAILGVGVALTGGLAG
jgi:hypothetical protein